MTSSVIHFFESFDSLSDRDRHDATVEILRRATEADLPPLTDEALVEIATTTFRELDEREAADERS